MSEQQTSYALPPLAGQEHPSAFMLPEPVDLGRHLLEVRAEDQTVVIFKKTQEHRLVELEKEEAYHLLVTLQWVFRQEIEQGESKDIAAQKGL